MADQLLPNTPTYRVERGDATRDKLLVASIDVFGRLGFDGATTRALADAGSVNLQAIPYYFGGKEGLYLAAADHIAALIASHVGDLRDRVRARLGEAERQGTPVAPNEARAFLSEILDTMATLFVSQESEPWARFISREQMAPTEAFTRIYGGVMKPLLEVVARLMAILLRDNAASEHIRLRALALIGSVLVFRMAHAAALAQLGWTTVGPREVGVVQALARELVAAIGSREAGP